MNEDEKIVSYEGISPGRKDPQRAGDMRERP